MGVTSYDVVVVSAFGRGHWLAAELRKERLNVLLLDMTSRLGSWPAEDREGPFGVFRGERYAESYVERMANDDAVETVDNGFCLWPPEGPFEFKGPLTRYQWEKSGFDLSWLEALSRGEKPSNVSPQTPFFKIWPLALAHQLGSTIYRPAAEAVKNGRPLPLSASFGIRFATRNGLTQNLKWLKERGVATSSQTEILDLSFRGRGRSEVAGMELKGEISGLINFDQMIWTLTGGETRFLSTRLLEHLYPGGVVEPDWCWVRYRLRVQSAPEIERMPLHCVMIDDLESPWTHSNLLILQKTLSEQSLDAWIRIPAIRRFNRDYLEEHGRRIMDFFAKRLPAARPEIQALPQEASYTSQELGEPQIPVWKEGDRPTKGRCKVANVSFENPENRETYGQDEEFDHQKNLRDRLLKWWQLKQQKLEKEKSQ